MIEVYIWEGANPAKVLFKDGAWGHASMKVCDGLPSGHSYISWWPMSEVYDSLKNDPETSHLVAGIDTDDLGVWAGLPYCPKNLAEDIRLEGGKKPKVITLRGLDETAIKAWWQSRLRNKSALYSATKGNCSTTVFMALVADGSYDYTPWYMADRPWFSSTPYDPETTNYPLIKPADVHEYALVVARKLEQLGKNSKKNFAIVSMIKDPLIQKAVKDALDDNGKLSLREVKYICQAAADKKGVTKQEIQDLKVLYKITKSTDKESKTYLKEFIKKNG